MSGMRVRSSARPGPAVRESPFQFRHGRGLAPPHTDRYARWFTFGPFAGYFNAHLWRFGVSLTKRSISLYLGPFTASLGRTTYRWRVVPRTTTLVGSETWQDFNVTFTTSGTPG